MPRVKEAPARSVMTEWLDYNAATGIFRRKKSPNNQIGSGTVAGCLDSDGYVRLRLMGHIYAAHRLAWFWVHNQWPPNLVDHIDGNKSNNRISNLRLATTAQNALNRGRRRGCAEFPQHGGGVSRERYRARINVNGKNIHLGSFDTEAEAVAAYALAVKLHEEGQLHVS